MQGNRKHTIESKSMEAKPKCNTMIHEFAKKGLDKVKSLTITQLKMLLLQHFQVLKTSLKKEYDIVGDVLLNGDATETENDM
jgi:hypothetical protein